MKRNRLSAAIAALLHVEPVSAFVITARVEGWIDPFDIWTMAL